MRRKTLILIILLFLAGTTMPSQAQNTFKQPVIFNDDGDGFVVIAHRGASAYFPENTMPAFEAALTMNAEMIELDVLLSKDGVPVVIHDAKLNRLTDRRGFVRDHTLAELKELDAGAWFDSKFAGTRIPTLEEVLQFAQDSIALNIEIKTGAVTDERDGGIEEKSLELVQKYGMRDHILFSSFDYRAVEHLKQLQPDIPVALLYDRRQSTGRSPSELISDYNADAFNCSYRQLTKVRQEDLKAHHIPTFIYTVNQPGRMKTLIEKGITGLITNKPDVLREVVSDLNRND